jgi:hypothetical protein
MHPEVMRALARERQAELLDEQQARHVRRRTGPLATGRDTAVLGRLRRSLGTALVLAGARLMRGIPVTVSLFDTQPGGSSRGRICRC